MANQQDWIPDVFRQKVRQQMDEAFTRFANPFSKTVEELEKTAFDVSNNSKGQYVPIIQNIMKRAQTTAATKQAQQVQRQQQQQQQLQQQGMSSQQGMMRPPMQPTQSMPMQQAPQMQGMQQMRQFNTPPMARGPPSDSPQNMNMQSPLSSGGITGYSPDNRMPHPSPGSQFYTHRPQIVGRPPQPQQQQQPQLRMPDNSYMNVSHGSVGSVGSTYIPSLSPAHPNNSPQVSAMSPALRTPGSVSVAHSPAGAAVPSPSTGQNQTNPVQTEEVLYMEKLKQLQKYIEPLSRMINKEKNSKDLSKMKSLRDVLMDSNKRLAMATLLKCEKVLKNWLDVKPPPTPPSKPNQHMCQPILDAVVTDMKSPMLNHTLKRTFGPALQVLNGDYQIPESSRTKRQRVHVPSEDEDPGAGIRVPNVVQGEVARLGSKFKVTVDQSQSRNCGALHLICRLDDSSLPSVPPIRIMVPSAYPQEGPEWRPWDSDDSSETEEFDTLLDPQNDPAEPMRPAFLSKLKPKMETHINHAMNHNETISAILTAWERSVKDTVASQVKVFV